MGASAVLIVDARDAARTGANEAVLGATGIRMHLLPDGATFDFESLALPAISPDGHSIVFGASSADGRRQLWLRRSLQPVG